MSFAALDDTSIFVVCNDTFSRPTGGQGGAGRGGAHPICEQVAASGSTSSPLEFFSGICLVFFFFYFSLLQLCVCADPISASVFPPSAEIGSLLSDSCLPDHPWSFMDNVTVSYNPKGGSSLFLLVC